MEKYNQGKDSIFGDSTKLPKVLSGSKDMMTWLTSEEFGKGVKKFLGLTPENFGFPATAPTPAMPANFPVPAINNTYNVNVTHHGDAKDTHSVGETHKAAVKRVYSQMPPLKGGH